MLIQIPSADSGAGETEMQSITELAATRRAAYDVIERSEDDEISMNDMQLVFAAETDILSAPLQTRADILAARSILYEDGQIDFNDSFKEQLTLRLLNAI
jgi:hypothetical protein